MTHTRGPRGLRPGSQHERSAGLDPGQRGPARAARHRGHPAVDRRSRRQRRGRAPQRRADRRARGAGHRRVGQRSGVGSFLAAPHHRVTRVLVRTDDEVYRVDSVWLGPPRATFPWRARYVSYGLGLLVMIVVMFVQRRIGIGLDFFSVAWALIITVRRHPLPRPAHQLRASARPGGRAVPARAAGPAPAHGGGGRRRCAPTTCSVAAATRSRTARPAAKAVARTSAAPETGASKGRPRAARRDAARSAPPRSSARARGRALAGEAGLPEVPPRPSRCGPSRAT